MAFGLRPCRPAAHSVEQLNIIDVGVILAITLPSPQIIRVGCVSLHLKETRFFLKNLVSRPDRLARSANLAANLRLNLRKAEQLPTKNVQICGRVGPTPRILNSFLTHNLAFVLYDSRCSYSWFASQNPASGHTCPGGQCQGCEGAARSNLNTARPRSLRPLRGSR